MTALAAKIATMMMMKVVMTLFISSRPTGEDTSAWRRTNLLSPLGEERIIRPRKKCDGDEGLQCGAGEPAGAAGVERIERGPLDAGHVGLHLVADLVLQIGEMAIAFGKA